MQLKDQDQLWTMAFGAALFAVVIREGGTAASQVKQAEAIADAFCERIRQKMVGE